MRKKPTIKCESSNFIGIKKCYGQPTNKWIAHCENNFETSFYFSMKYTNINGYTVISDNVERGNESSITNWQSSVDPKILIPPAICHHSKN